MILMLKKITFFFLLHIIAVSAAISQPLTANEITIKLKGSTVIISNNQQKIPAFFIADKILLTYPKAIDNFRGDRKSVV